MLRIEKTHLMLLLFISDCLVAWLSKKQNSISLSTIEAKYLVVGSCCTQFLWINKWTKELIKGP